MFGSQELLSFCLGGILTDFLNILLNQLINDLPLLLRVTLWSLLVDILLNLWLVRVSSVKGHLRSIRAWHKRLLRDDRLLVL